jgi:hypothetical protein
MISPRTSTPANFEKNVDNVEEDYVEDVTHGMIRKTSTTVLRLTQMESTMTSQKTTTDSVNRPSRDGSETDLTPPARDRDHRISGPWSRAFAVLDRG